MSCWMHVSGIARVDDLRTNGDKGMFYYALKQILGTPAFYDERKSDEDEASTWKNCKLPMGSEGSIRYAIEVNAENSMAAYTVAFWGDLRDVSTIDEFDKWFRSFVNATFEVDTPKGKQSFSFMFRDVVFHVTIENGIEWFYTVKMNDDMKYEIIATEVR